jgi:RND family efflux transporter MFP subunit
MNLHAHSARRTAGTASPSLTIDPLENSSREKWSVNSQSREIVDAVAADGWREERAHGSQPASAGVWRYTIPALLLILLAALGYWRIEKRSERQSGLMAAVPTAALTPVAVVHAQPSDANQNVTLPGNVQAFVDTPIYARTAGYLTKWFVDIGGKVEAGQLLAVIDTPEVDQQLRQAEAAQLQAEANLNLAKTTAERWQNLLKSDGVSQQEVDQNVSAYKARQADFQAAVANVDRLKYLQSFQRVTAPYAGVITARNVDIGALIANGNSQQLFKLAQTDTLRVYVNVPEPYGNAMRPGISAELHVAEFVNRAFTGKVVRTAGAIDPASRTLLTEVDVPNPTGEIMPGAFAEVSFKFKGDSRSLVVPSNTLIFRSAGSQVAVVENGHAKLHAVTIGRDLGANLEVVAGLRATDDVILNPPDSLSDGQAVAVQSSQSESSHPDEQPASAGSLNR